MSKIGQKPVRIEDGVEIQISNDKVHIKGSKGELFVDVPRTISVKQVEQDIIVERSNETKKVKSLHGLIRSLINNAVIGVNKPWEKNLMVVGTGYRVKLKGKDLVFEVGYSHNVEFKEKEGISFTVDGGKVTVSGIDKQKVGEVANKIKSIKKPDPYKGKGIRYEGEVLHLKPGKKAKTA